MRVVKAMSEKSLYFVYMQTSDMSTDRPADYMIEKRDQNDFSASGWHMIPRGSEASMNVVRTLKEAKAQILAHEIRIAESEAHEENNARAKAIVDIDSRDGFTFTIERTGGQWDVVLTRHPLVNADTSRVRIDSYKWYRQAEECIDNFLIDANELVREMLANAETEAYAERSTGQGDTMSTVPTTFSEQLEAIDELIEKGVLGTELCPEQTYWHWPVLDSEQLPAWLAESYRTYGEIRL